jgi:hypothetical protein
LSTLLQRPQQQVMPLPEKAIYLRYGTHFLLSDDDKLSTPRMFKVSSLIDKRALSDGLYVLHVFFNDYAHPFGHTREGCIKDSICEARKHRPTASSRMIPVSLLPDTMACVTPVRQIAAPLLISSNQGKLEVQPPAPGLASRLLRKISTYSSAIRPY